MVLVPPGMEVALAPVAVMPAFSTRQNGRSQRTSEIKQGNFALEAKFMVFMPSGTEVVLTRVVVMLLLLG